MSVKIKIVSRLCVQTFIVTRYVLVKSGEAMHGEREFANRDRLTFADGSKNN